MAATQDVTHYDRNGWHEPKACPGRECPSYGVEMLKEGDVVRLVVDDIEGEYRLTSNRAQSKGAYTFWLVPVES